MTLMLPPQSPADPTTDRLRAREHAYRSFDNAELFYRSWQRSSPPTRAVVLLHRGHEHSGRSDELARWLVDDRTAVFAPDQRGHGRSPGKRGYADSFATLVRDIDAFVRHVSATHQIEPRNFAVVGHSISAVALATWVHDYAPSIRAMVLATPAFRVKLYVPFALTALRVRNALGRGRSFIKSYVRRACSRTIRSKHGATRTIR